MFIYNVRKDKSYPGFTFEGLKQPVYSTAYIEPTENDATAEVYATYDRSMEQQIEFENFF